MLLMGLGQIRNRQIGKGILLILAELAFIVYFALIGVTDFIGLFTLDFTQPVKVVTESPYVIRKLEILKRKQERALA